MIHYTHCLRNDYTYKDLTKPVNRDYMKMLGVSTLGTQAGGFGIFKPEFKVVSVESVDKIKQELFLLCKEECFNIDNMEKISPTIFELIK